MWTHADGDPDPVQTFQSQKVEFLRYMKNIRKVGIRYRNRYRCTTKIQKPFRKAGNYVYLYTLVDMLLDPTRAKIPNNGTGSRTANDQMNADPCGSGSITLPQRLFTQTTQTQLHGFFPYEINTTSRNFFSYISVISVVLV
jgi:hypothetical protein